METEPDILESTRKFNRLLDSFEKIKEYYSEEKVISNLDDSFNEKDSPDRYEIMLNLLMRAAED
jgi:hypothetical protein